MVHPSLLLTLSSLFLILLLYYYRVMP